MQQVVKAIARRRLDWTSATTTPNEKYQKQQLQQQKRSEKNNQAPNAEVAKPKEPPARGASRDPTRLNMIRQIEQLREEHKVSESQY